MFFAIIVPACYLLVHYCPHLLYATGSASAKAKAVAVLLGCSLPLTSSHHRCHAHPCHLVTPSLHGTIIKRDFVSTKVLKNSSLKQNLEKGLKMNFLLCVILMSKILTEMS